MDRLLHDVRIALRGFRRTRAFTAAVVAILALGIGMASTMAAVTDAVLRRPLPVQAPVFTADGDIDREHLASLARWVLRRDGRELRAAATALWFAWFGEPLVPITTRDGSN